MFCMRYDNRLSMLRIETILVRRTFDSSAKETAVHTRRHPYVIELVLFAVHADGRATRLIGFEQALERHLNIDKLGELASGMHLFPLLPSGTDIAVETQAETVEVFYI